MRHVELRARYAQAEQDDGRGRRDSDDLRASAWRRFLVTHRREDAERVHQGSPVVIRQLRVDALHVLRASTSIEHVHALSRSD